MAARDAGIRAKDVTSQGRGIVLPGMELMGCADLAVPADVMHHVVTVESSYNPYAIGVVGGRLQRQPRSLAEALATVRMLERRGYNFSVGLAQVNRHNLDRQGLTSYERAFDRCANLQAGSRILAECQRRANDWGKAFSCYYSGNFTTGFRHGYVQKVYASMRAGSAPAAPAIALASPASPSITRRASVPARHAPQGDPLVMQRSSATATGVMAAGNPAPTPADAIASATSPQAAPPEAPTPNAPASTTVDAAFVF